MAKKEIYEVEIDSTRSKKRGSDSSKGKSKRDPKDAKKRRIRRIILIVEALIIAIAAIAAYIYFEASQVTWVELEEVEVNDLAEETVEVMKGYTTVALFGLDNRSNGTLESGNSDTIIICSINNDTGDVSLVSVYRDTVMDVNGELKLRKANYAYNHGGPQEAIETLNRNLDLNIQQFITVDFYAMAEVVDGLGGIELDITSSEASYMNGEGGYIDLTGQIVGKTSSDVIVGTQLVDGVQAVSYCRIRYTAGGDFKRALRQRTVISKITDKAKTSSLTTLNKIANSVFDDIATNISLTDILSLLADANSYNLTEMCGYPFNMTTNEETSLGSIVVACDLESNVKQLHYLLYGTEDYQPTDTVLEISQTIIDYTGVTADDAVDYGY